MCAEYWKYEFDVNIYWGLILFFENRIFYRFVNVNIQKYDLSMFINRNSIYEYLYVYFYILSVFSIHIYI